MNTSPCWGFSFLFFWEKEIIEKFAFHLFPFYVEKLIFLLLYFLCRQLTLGVHATEIYFVFNVDDFHSYQRSEEENERQRYGKCLFEGGKKKCLNLFVKALIDKTSDKFITCKIQFDATLLWLASTTAIEAYYLSIQFGILVVKSIEKWILAFFTLNKSLTILTSIILIDDGDFVYFVILCFKSFLKRLEIFAITSILRFNWNMKIHENHWTNRRVFESTPSLFSNIFLTNLSRWSCWT